MEPRWDFARWRDALREAGPRRASLVGLAAAERAAGCLADDRAARFGEDGRGPARAVLDACWERADAAALGRSRTALEDWTARYAERSLTAQYQAWAEEDGEDDTGPPELAEFLAEAEPEGAVALHLTAATAVAEASLAFADGPWDGALRCLQSLADLPGESERQLADLTAVLETDDEELPAAERHLRREAASDAAVYRAYCKSLALDAD